SRIPGERPRGLRCPLPTSTGRIDTRARVYSYRPGTLSECDDGVAGPTSRTLRATRVVTGNHRVAKLLGPRALPAESRVQASVTDRSRGRSFPIRAGLTGRDGASP